MSIRLLFKLSIMSEEEDFTCERVIKCKNLTIIPITKLRLTKKKLNLSDNFL